jgi:acetoacetyl-CoA synthetase
MMWNLLMGGLLAGATALLYDGSPGHPDMNVLWKFAEETRHDPLRDQRELPHGLHEGRGEPGRDFDLSALKGVGSTGSPLRPRASGGSTSTSRRTCGCTQRAAAPTCARRS